MKSITFSFLAVAIVLCNTENLKAQNILGKLKNKIEQAVNKQATQPQQNPATTNQNPNTKGNQPNSNSQVKSVSNQNQQSNPTMQDISMETITFITNPQKYNLFIQPFIYKDKMYLVYKPVENQENYRLVEFDGNSFNELVTPNETDSYIGLPFVYNGDLYLKYRTNMNHGTGYKLARYDGKKIQFINCPGKGYGIRGDYEGVYLDCPIIYNNKLYFNFSNDGYPQLAEFNGQTIQFIENKNEGEYKGDPFVYNKKLYVKYYNVRNGTYYLGEYNESSFKLIPISGYLGSPILYNKELYIKFYINGKNYLAKFDGKKVDVLPGPENLSYDGEPIEYKNKLYLKYSNATGGFQLAEFDGTNIKVVAFPDNSGSAKGYMGASMIFNNKLYFNYNQNQLAEFDGSRITLIPNPNSLSLDYHDSVIIYHNKMYLNYRNTRGQGRLVQFDGTTLNIITISSTNYGSEGYGGIPIVYNNKLYFQYFTALKTGIAYIDTK